MARRDHWRQTPLGGLGGASRGGAFVEARRRFRTDLIHRGPAPVRGAPLVATDDLEVVAFRSGPRSLRAWLRVPAHRRLARAGRLPVLVYLHGAYTLERAALDALAPFTDAGVAIFAPTFRGEHDNPGDHELFLGEIDDARAAVDAAGADRRLDPERVLVFGHSGGGLSSAMLALDPTLPALDTGSVNGVYDTWLFDHVEHLPFRDGPEERRVRAFAPHVRELARPHLACVGDGDRLIADRSRLEALAAEARAPLEIRVVPGDHYGAIGPAVRVFFARTIDRLRG